MARERTLEDIAEQVDWLTKQVEWSTKQVNRLPSRLDDRMNKAPFVRVDLYNVEMRSIRERLDSLHTMLMWILTILSGIVVAVVVTVISAVARGGFG